MVPVNFSVFKSIIAFLFRTCLSCELDDLASRLVNENFIQ